VLRVSAVLAFGTVVGVWVPFSAWTAVSQELSIFFGLIGAALPQAMALTMQAQPPRKLSPKEAQAFAAHTRRQQVYWFALFLLSGFAIVVLIGGKVLSQADLLGSAMTVSFPWLLTFVGPPWPFIPSKVHLAPFMSALMGSLVGLLAYHFIGMGRVIISLQALRGRSLEAEAHDQAVRRIEQEQPAQPYETPKGYGDVVKPPKPRRAGGKGIS
jgi:hypothetical protein